MGFNEIFSKNKVRESMKKFSKNEKVKLEVSIEKDINEVIEKFLNKKKLNISDLDMLLNDVKNDVSKFEKVITIVNKEGRYTELLFKFIDEMIDRKPSLSYDLIDFVKSRYGDKSILIASEFGTLELMKKLVAEGVDLYTADESGWTALHFSSANGQLNVVRYLINEGFDVNVRNKDGMTPLQYAVIFKHRDIVEFLLENGANPLLGGDKNYNGPFDLAYVMNDLTLMYFLKQAILNYAKVNKLKPWEKDILQFYKDYYNISYPTAS